MIQTKWRELLDRGEQAAARCASLKPTQRSNLLFRAADMLAAKKDAFAALIQREEGKSAEEALSEVDKSVFAIQRLAAEGENSYGEIIPDPEPDTASRLILQPAGFCAAITSWHHPLLSPVEQCAACFAAGSSMMLLPSKWATLTAELFVGICEEAGFPADSICLAAYDTIDEIVQLAQESRIRYLFCEGDDALCENVAEGRARCLGRASYRAQDSAPMVVCVDGNWELAAQTAAQSAFSNGGQSPMCVKRVYVARPLLERFLEKLTAAARGWPGVRLCREQDYQALADKLRSAGDEGAVRLTGEIAPEGVVQPFVLTGDSIPAVFLEPIIGPCVAIDAFDALEEAAQKANSSVYGGTAYVFSNDLMTSHRLCTMLDAGVISVNRADARLASVPDSPRKHSGYGAALGREGVRSYMQTKHIRMSYL